MINAGVRQSNVSAQIEQLALLSRRLGSLASSRDRVLGEDLPRVREVRRVIRDLRQDAIFFAGEWENLTPELKERLRAVAEGALEFPDVNDQAAEGGDGRPPYKPTLRDFLALPRAVWRLIRLRPLIAELRSAYVAFADVILSLLEGESEGYLEFIATRLNEARQKTSGSRRLVGEQEIRDYVAGAFHD